MKVGELIALLEAFPHDAEVDFGGPEHPRLALRGGLVRFDFDNMQTTDVHRIVYSDGRVTELPPTREFRSCASRSNPRRRTRSTA